MFVTITPQTNPVVNHIHHHLPSPPLIVTTLRQNPLKLITSTPPLHIFLCLYCLSLTAHNSPPLPPQSTPVLFSLHLNSPAGTIPSPA
ncbi:MAG: hypothetical protein NZM04_08680 [Methylacidiphilales bacterium]|nr:hypothetical protein [Candidatus Methylacidiphilales bacterium]